MSSITEVTRTSNQVNVSYDFAKLALGDNEFITGVYTPAGNGTLAEGTVFGRISATGKLKPADKDATDGSQYPVGIFYNAIGGAKTVVAATDYELTLINKGKVDAGLLTFATGESLDSVVSDRQYRDHLAAIGIILESPSQLTDLDN